MTAQRARHPAISSSALGITGCRLSASTACAESVERFGRRGWRRSAWLADTGRPRQVGGMPPALAELVRRDSAQAQPIIASGTCEIKRIL